MWCTYILNNGKPEQGLCYRISVPKFLPFQISWPYSTRLAVMYNHRALGLTRHCSYPASEAKIASLVPRLNVGELLVMLVWCLMPSLSLELKPTKQKIDLLSPLILALLYCVVTKTAHTPFIVFRASLSLSLSLSLLWDGEMVYAQTGLETKYNTVLKFLPTGESWYFIFIHLLSGAGM